MRVLGTLNGFATSFSAIGRAIGPAIGGPLFTVGVKRGYVIAPWWMFTLVGILGAIPVWWIIEGKGFDNEDDKVVDEDESGEVLREEGLEGGADAPGKLGPVLVPTQENIENQGEEDDEIGPLSRATTMSSRISLGSALTVDSNGDDLDEMSNSLAGRSSSARRTSRTVIRRMSNPIGMGEQGISRSYSSNLGQSLGSYQAQY